MGKLYVVGLGPGDYDNMTVYSDDPVAVAKDFKSKGATHLHIVDLEGARRGNTSSIDTIARIVEETGLFCEIGGGVRSMAAVQRYQETGVSRIIIGTAAITDEPFLKQAIWEFEDLISVGVDIKDGRLAIKGWVETSNMPIPSFLNRIGTLGVKNVVCTDISRDGTMEGPNVDLYRRLSDKFDLSINASGGITTVEDIKKLSAMNLYGAIIGKAYYDGVLSIEDAIEAAK